MTSAAASTGKNANMAMTVGKTGSAPDAAAAGDDKKTSTSKEGVTAGGPAKTGLSKLKDPNQAHETLEM
jgi:hypothetical protein